MQAPESRLWFAAPARAWEEALPLGNGHLGAMLFGHPAEERLELNEGTLWSGFPRDDVNYEARRHLARARAHLAAGEGARAQAVIETGMLGRTPEAYQPLGTLHVRRAGAVQGGYHRELKLRRGLYRVDAGEDRRVAFASYPDGVLAYRWEVGGDPADFHLSLGTPHPGEVAPLERGLRLRAALPSRVLDNYAGDHPEPVGYEP